MVNITIQELTGTIFVRHFNKHSKTYIESIGALTEKDGKYYIEHDSVPSKDKGLFEISEEKYKLLKDKGCFHV